MSGAALTRHPAAEEPIISGQVGRRDGDVGHDGCRRVHPGPARSIIRTTAAGGGAAQDLRDQPLAGAPRQLAQVDLLHSAVGPQAREALVDLGSLSSRGSCSRRSAPASPSTRLLPARAARTGGSVYHSCCRLTRQLHSTQHSRAAAHDLGDEHAHRRGPERQPPRLRPGWSEMMTLSRREFIQAAAAMGATLAWGGPARASRPMA